MAALSDFALVILDHMEPQRAYDLRGLKGLAPQLNQEALREVMRDLWIASKVERCGDDGWRRARSRRVVATRVEVDPATLRIGVKPQDLFDHESFKGLFK